MSTTIKCSECYAPIKPNSERCEYCGFYFVKKDTVKVQYDGFWDNYIDSLNNEASYMVSEIRKGWLPVNHNKEIAQFLSIGILLGLLGTAIALIGLIK